MKNISKKLLFVMLVAALFLTACGSTQPSISDDAGPDAVILDQTGDKTTKVASDYFGVAYYDGENVNPIVSKSKVNHSLCQLLYEGLFVLDSQFQPQNVLCESWSSPDGRTFTITVKSGIHFWSGAELTAEDVAYTLNQAKNNENSVYKKRMEQVSGIKQNDNYTLTVTLSGVNYDFVSLLDLPIFRKGSIDEKFADGTGCYHPVTENNETTLQVFDDWHGEIKPSAYQTLTLVPATRTDAVMSSFEIGDVSMTPLDRLGVQGQSVKGALDVYKAETTKLHFLILNQGKPLFQSAAVRQALSELMDRKTLCENQLQDYAVPAVLPVNPQPAGYESNQTVNKTDAAAKLKAAGFTDNDGDGRLEHLQNGRTVTFTFSVLVNEENAFKTAVLERYAEDLATVGIRLKVDAVSYAEYEKRLVSRDFDAAYCETVLTSDFNLTPLLAAGGALNYGNTTGLENLIIAARSYPQGEQKMAAQKALYDAFLNTMPILPIGFERQQVITRNRLAQGIDPLPYDIYYGIENWTKE